MKDFELNQINPHDYVTFNTILRVSRKKCTRDEPKVSSIKFKFVDIKEKKLTLSNSIFVLTYSALNEKYTLKQEFTRIPTILNEFIIINTMCCEKHFPKLVDDDLMMHMNNESLLFSQNI